MIVDKDVAMPERQINRAAGETIYPFNEMEIGDSVFFPDQKPGGKASNAAIKTASRKKKHFIIRKVEGGIRIWRDE